VLPPAVKYKSNEGEQGSWHKFSSGIKITTPHAMALPSRLAVPRPSSSTKTRLFSPLCLQIYAASFISIKNVDRLFSISSPVPIRDKRRWRTGKKQSSAGTKHPICARTVIKATCFRYLKECKQVARNI